MKYIKTYELYDSNYQNYIINDIEIKNREDVDITMTLNVTIEEMIYEFKLWFNRDNMLYFDYHIVNWSRDFDHKKNKYYKDSWSDDNINKYNFIANKKLMLKVLNFLPEMVNIFKENVKDTDHINRDVLGWYYDCDEHRRARIYEYYFDKRFKGNIKEKLFTSYKKYYFENIEKLENFNL